MSNGTGVAFARYVSTSTEARERQWRHFYYAQDTWRANSKLTLNYGLRLDVINPQTVNEAGNGTWVDLATGLGLVGGVGDIDLGGNVENRLNWAPRLGATYQLNEKTVIRGGYGRSYDIGVFGSLFGHTVTQNLPVLAAQNMTGPSQFASVFNLAQGPPAPSTVQPSADGTFEWPDGIKPLVVPRKQRPPEVDAWNITVQRQLSDTMSVEVGYVGNYGAPRVRRGQPGREPEPGGPRRLPGRRAVQPAPSVLRRRREAERARRRRQLRLDAEGAGLSQRGAELVQGAADEVHPALQQGLVGAGELHAAARHQHDDE